MKTKKILCLILSCLLLLPVFCFGCGEPNPPPHTFKQSDFLTVDGTEVRSNNRGAVMLRGTNAGGYLLIEEWMTSIIGVENNKLDHKKTTEIFVERFGKQKTLQLWETYRNNFWTEQDFANCAEMGVNVIRLPFSYMSLDPEYDNVTKINGQKYNFSLLDNFVRKAESYGIYTMLDLHGAYGSQNGMDHSGERIENKIDVDFFSNEEKQQKTIDLWAAIANRYKDDPAIAGYDILNEPAEHAGTTTAQHWEFFDKVYEAIRAEDERHIVIFESCWDGPNLPRPEVYGWENCMYSFHHYTSYDTNNSHLKSMKLKLDNVEAMKFGIPLHMGEFTCYGVESDWTGTFEMFRERGWHWTTWTYKLHRKPVLNSEMQEVVYTDSAWGVFNTRGAAAVPEEMTYDQIIAAWESIKTQSDSTVKYYFSVKNEETGNREKTSSLFDVIKAACNA